MPYVEVANSKHSLLLLTRAVVQLIQSSTEFNKEHMISTEIHILTYQKSKQAELLNQLFEVILLQIRALSAYDQDIPSVYEYNDIETMESSLWILLTQLLDLSKLEISPKEEYILSIERLRSKLIQPTSKHNEESPMVPLLESQSNEIVEIKERTSSIIDPILHWSKNEPNKPSKQRKNNNNKNRDDQSFQIKIGSMYYKGFL